MAMEPDEPDIDDMLRKLYREAILKIDSERSAFDPNSETYKGMLKAPSCGRRTVDAVGEGRTAAPPKRTSRTGVNE